jgi:hypothetical protein
MTTPTELAERLEPKHLTDAAAAVPSKTDDLKAEVERAVEPPQAEEQKLDDPKLEEKYAFHFDWKDRRGRRHVGDFVNQILSIRDRQLAGVMRARLAGGMPQESLDPLTDELNLMVSHMAFSLVEKPDWANELRDVKDPALLQEIYKEVLSHEATFLGWGNPEAAG